MQILPHKYCKAYDVQKILPVNHENETVHYFRVEVSDRIALVPFDRVTVNYKSTFSCLCRTLIAEQYIGSVHCQILV